MPKLIIDQMALDLIVSRIEGQPIFMGPDGKMLAPGLIDLLEPSDSAYGWRPHNERTRMLILGGEACRDVLFYSDRLIDSKTRLRAMRGIAVPICKLMDIVVSLVSQTNDESSRKIRGSWPLVDRKIYQLIAKRLKKVHHKGPVRSVRNRLSAHLDSDVFDVSTPDLVLKDVLSAFGDCIVLLILSMNYPSKFFCWIRDLGVMPDGQHRVVETMYEYPLSFRWITDLEGHVVDVESAVLAEDPRHELQKQFFEATRVYNAVVSATGARLSLITLKEQEAVDDRW